MCSNKTLIQKQINCFKSRDVEINKHIAKYGPNCFWIVLGNGDDVFVMQNPLLPLLQKIKTHSLTNNSF
jgi:hypothetical protein